jgi:hypothetical protein
MIFENKMSTQRSDSFKEEVTASTRVGEMSALAEVVD